MSRTENRKADDCLSVSAWTRETRSSFFGSSKKASSRQAYSSQAEEWKTYIQIHSTDQKKRCEYKHCDSSMIGLQ